MNTLRSILVLGLTSLLFNSALGDQAPAVDDQSPATPAGIDQPATDPTPPRGTERGPRRDGGRGERGSRAQVPDSVELVRDVVYATVAGADGQPIELKMDTAFLKQSDGKPMPVVVYIHGGGWRSGSKDAGLPHLIAYAQGGYFAVSIDYRLSDVAPFPAAVHDCKAAIRFLRAHAEQLGIDPNRIGVWGHSAGGHLSAMLGLSADDPTIEGEVGTTGVSSAVQCVVTVSGPADLLRMGEGGNDAAPGQSRRTGGGIVDLFLGGPAAEKPDLARQASPVSYVDANDPPFLIVHGTKDELVPFENAQLLLEKILAANGKAELEPIDGAGHAIHQREAMARIARFFDERLGGTAAAHLAAREPQERRPRGAGRPPRGDDMPAVPTPPPTPEPAKSPGA